MNYNSPINDLFVTAYDALVNVFAYTVGSLSKSLPQSDYFCKAANELLPVANQLLATTKRYEQERINILSKTTSDLLEELCTSGKQRYDAIQSLGLLPLIQKIQKYRELVINTK